MPVYEYECGCGERFEKLRPISEYQEPSPCPKCNVGTERVMSTYRIGKESESFTVVGSDGEVMSQKRVSSFVPEWNDPASKPDMDLTPSKTGRPQVCLDRRTGTVFYDRTGLDIKPTMGF